MMKTYLCLALLTLAVSGCINKGNSLKEKTTIPRVTASSSVKPKISWKVNREFDAKGNVTRYDSVYSWSYSSNGGVAAPEADSMFKVFQSCFQKHMEGVLNSNQLAPLLENDFFDMRVRPETKSAGSEL